MDVAGAKTTRMTAVSRSEDGSVVVDGPRFASLQEIVWYCEGQTRAGSAGASGEVRARLGPYVGQQPSEPQQPAGGSAVPATESDCRVKGNVSSSGEPTYQVPGDSYYDVTDPEECFATEADAVAGGYRASKR